MNTDALLQVDARHAASAERHLLHAEERAHECERIFSRFIPESELCGLNASSGRWVNVSREMSAVLDLSFGLHTATNGLFDPAILPDLERAGYDRTFEALPADGDAATEPVAPSARFADIDLARGRARLPEGLRIDLGGIVKGWTADLLADELSDAGPCLVELGGDAAVRGVPRGRDGWEVGVRAPGSTDVIGVVRLRDGGVATSGTDARRWKRGGRWAHHLIDPRTRQPSTSTLVQVTAFAERTAFAEVWAKTALISGRCGSEWIQLQHPELRLVLVEEGKDAVISEGVPFVYGPPVPA